MGMGKRRSEMEVHEGVTREETEVTASMQMKMGIEQCSTHQYLLSSFGKMTKTTGRMDKRRPPITINGSLNPPA